MNNIVLKELKVIKRIKARIEHADGTFSIHILEKDLDLHALNEYISSKQKECL